MFEGMNQMELEHEGTLLRGYAAVPEGVGPFPAVLVMHSAIGIAHGVNEPAARKLAAKGYLAICTDMYGAHLEGAGQELYGPAMGELNHQHPDKQRRRTVAWFDAIAARPDVDPDRIGAIGFCYGGTTALELARSGANVKAVMSYHGILSTYERGCPGAFKGQVVAFCGAGDPWAPQEDIEALRQEMIAAGHRDYQITLFGAADHAFTDPEAAVLGLEAVRFHELSNDLSWKGTLGILEHVFR